MKTPFSRRAFLSHSSAAGSLAGFGGLSFLESLPGVSAGEAALPAGTVRRAAGVEASSRSPQLYLLTFRDGDSDTDDELRRVQYKCDAFIDGMTLPSTPTITATASRR